MIGLRLMSTLSNLELTKRTRVPATALIYTWAVIMLICGVFLASETADNVRKFVVVGWLLLFALSVLFALRPALGFVRDFIGSLIVIFLPLFVYPSGAGHLAIEWQLYYVLIVALPVLLSLWHWHMQLVTVVCSSVAIFQLVIPLSPQAARYSVVFICVSGILFTLLGFLRTKYQHHGRAGVEIVHRLRVLPLSRHIASVVFLQVSLVAVMTFIDFADVIGHVSGTLVSRLCALGVIVAMPVLLTALKQERGAIIILLTLLLAAILSSPFFKMQSSSMGSLARLIEPALILICISQTTVQLPWALSRQIALAWSLTFLGLSGYTFYWFIQVHNVPFAFIFALRHCGLEISVMSLGIASSVIISAVIQRYRLIYSASFLAKLRYSCAQGDKSSEQEGRSQPEGSYKVLSDSWRGLGWKRIDRMLKMQLVLTILIGVCVYVWFFELGFNKWAIVSFGALWFSLLLLSKLNITRRNVGFFGAFIALLMFLWISGLVIFSHSLDRFWLILPFGLLVSFGLIPWRLRELIPFVMAGLIVGMGVPLGVDPDNSRILLFGTACLITVLWSVVSYRAMREHFVLTEFGRDLRECNDVEEFLRVFADYLTVMFDTHGVLISKGKTHLEIVRNSNAFDLPLSSWPIREMCIQSIKGVEAKADMKIHPLNSLPSHYSFYDERFGAFFAEHGILLELRCPQLPEFGSNGVDSSRLLIPTDVQLGKALVFIPLRVPFLRGVLRSEVALTYSLAEKLQLGFRLLHERYHRFICEKRANESATGHSYEISSLVHEINNSVQDLILLCEMALDDYSSQCEIKGDETSSQDDNFAANMRRISVVAQTMATVVSDMKRKREFEDVRSLEPRVLVDLCSVLEDSLVFAGVRAQRRRISVTHELAHGEALWVRVSSKDHLETAIRTLLGNAIDYSKSSTAVSMVLRYSDEWLWIRFKDTGPGLSKEEISRVFGYGDVSSRLINTTGDTGLLQCKKFVESQGGALDVTSDGAGLGTTFTIMLPRHSGGGVLIGENAWALLVDDEQTITQSYSRIAKAFNLAPIVAHSVSEACKIISENARPTFVITDLLIGDSDGYAVISSLREKFGKSLPILVISGVSDKVVRENVKAKGATDFVTKPIGQRELFNRIQVLLRSLD